MASTYLSRTPTTETINKLTLSCWVKRTGLGVNSQRIFSHPTTDYLFHRFESNDTFRFIISLPAGLTDMTTNRVFRDTSAWYHIHVVWNSTETTESNRIKLYVNGVQETSFSTSLYPALNATTSMFNSGTPFEIGRYAPGNSEFLNANLAHLHCCSGYAYDASYFGETDATTGIWKPKTAPSVTYGTNGFFLKFENSASLGLDSSPSTNNFTVNGTPTQTVDTPSNVFATWNSLNNLSTSGSGTLTKGNLEVSYSGGAFNTNATIAVSTGKWFWETKGVSNMQQGSVGARIGFLNQDNTGYANQNFDGNCKFGMFWHPTIGIYTCDNPTQTLRNSTTYTDGDIIGLALDLTNNISYWYKNGTLSFTYDFSAIATIGSYYICPALGNGSGTASPVFQTNFGNGFFGTTAVSTPTTDESGLGTFEYTVPAGYYALCTKNINTQEYA